MALAKGNLRVTGLNDGKETDQVEVCSEGSTPSGDRRQPSGNATQLEKVGTDKGERERKKEDGGPFKGIW